MMIEVATVRPAPSQAPTPPSSPRQPLDTMYLVSDLIQAALNQAKETASGCPMSDRGYAFALSPEDQLVSTLEKALNAISGSECAQQAQGMVPELVDQTDATDANFGGALHQEDCTGTANPESASRAAGARESIPHHNQMQGWTTPLDTADSHKPAITLRHMKNLIRDIVLEARPSGSEALSRHMEDFMQAVEELGAVNDEASINFLTANSIQLQCFDVHEPIITMAMIRTFVDDVAQEVSTMTLWERLNPVEGDKLSGHVERLTAAVENLITVKAEPRNAEPPFMDAVTDLIQAAIHQAKAVASLRHEPPLGSSSQDRLMSTPKKALAALSRREYMLQAQRIATAKEVYILLPLE